MKEYIKMRNSQQLDDNFIFKYYLENGGKVKNKEQFLDIFYFNSTPLEVNGQILGYQKTNRDLSTFWEDMDRKFGLQTLWSKDGNFIKVVS